MYSQNNTKYKCNECKKEKSLELFCRGSTTKCKKCHANYQRRWYFAKKTGKKVADVSLDSIDDKKLRGKVAETSNENSTDDEDSTSDEEKDRKIAKLEKTVRNHEKQLKNFENMFNTMLEAFAESHLGEEKKKKRK